MRQAALAILMVVAFVALAGSGPAPGTAAQPRDIVALGRDALTQRLAVDGAPAAGGEFALTGYRESIAGRHLHFQQTIDGVPLFGGELTVSLKKDADVVTTISGRELPNVRAALGPDAVSEDKALVLARKAVRVRGALRGAETAEAVYYPLDANTAARAWQVRLPANEPLGDWVVLVSASDGAVLHIENRIRFDHPAIGQVFDPNPVVSSGDAIPPPTECDLAASETTLSSEYVMHELPEVNAGQGQLVGPYVDLRAPGIPNGYKPAGLANELSHVFVYPCNDDRFEEVMIYYHVDRVQRLVQSLGFTGASALQDGPIPAYAHFDTACRAFYAGALYFGDGADCNTNTDTAEDADVIVHEYGHALQDDAINGYLGGQEGSGMAEGFADFLAAAVFGDPCMFEWVASPANLVLGIRCTPTLKNPDLGPFRDLLNDQHYPEDLHSNEHVTGLIWGGALWDLVIDLGGDEAARMKVLRMVLESHFALESTSNFHDAYVALRQADVDLYGGADVVAIDNVFARRGIIPVANPGGDDDGDGCTNGREVGTNQAGGGKRNPLYVWDFFDAPNAAAMPQRDRVVNLNDIFRVAARFATTGDPTGDPLSPAPPTGYHTAYDRSPPIGPNIWNLGPADGSIGLNEIYWSAGQFAHNCT